MPAVLYIPCITCSQNIRLNILLVQSNRDAKLLFETSPKGILEAFKKDVKMWRVGVQ